MRWLVYGAGAIGGVLGARLFEAGLDVLLVARGAHLDAMRARGLTLATPTGTRTLAIPVVGSAQEADLRGPTTVLLTVKSHQTAAALVDLVDATHSETPIVAVQNGVANERTLLRHFSDVQAVCVRMPASHLDAGVVEQRCSPIPGILDIGAYPGGVTATTTRIADAFRSADFVSETREDVMVHKHRKLLMNLGNAVQACCAAGAAADELDRRAEAEGEEVLAAAGIGVLSAEADRERRGDLLRRAPIGGRPRGGGSSWQSLRRSTGTIESDYLNGEIVLLGRLHEVPTPVNELLRRTAVRMAHEGAEPGSLDAADLLARLD